MVGPASSGSGRSDEKVGPEYSKLLLSKPVHTFS